MKAHKIYSLTILAYVKTITGIMPKIHYEFDESKGYLFYGVFEATDEVNKALSKYYTRDDDSTLFMDFLESLTQIIERKKKVRQMLDDINTRKE